MDLSTLGPSAASVVVVIFFLRYVTKKDEADESRNKLFAEALNGLTESTIKTNQAIIKESRLSRQVQEKGFNEAKLRNGHLVDVVKDNQTNNNANQIIMMEALFNIKNHIGEVQGVEEQTIE